MAIDLQARRDLEQRLDKAGAVLGRHRHAVGPMMVAVAITGVCSGMWALHAWRGWGWPQWSVTAVAAFVFLLSFSAVKELPNAREKQYARLAFISSCAYATSLAWLGPQVWLLVAGGTAAVCLGIPWYIHRRVRISVSVEKEIAAWGDGSAVGLPGVELVQAAAKAGKDWWSAPMRAKERGQWTRGQMRQAKERIAARYGVAVSQVDISDMPSEGEALLTVRTSTGPRVVECMPLPTTRVDIRGPKEVGRYPDGERSYVVLHKEGTGAIDGAALGVKGSGKSSWAELIAEHTISSTNGLLWIVDLKPGAQHWRPWFPAADWPVDSPEKLDAMFQVIEVINQYRGERTEGTIHVPTPTAPHITIIIDEAALAFSPKLGEVGDYDAQVSAAQVIGRRVQSMEDSIRVNRSFGIGTYEMSQYALNDAYGSGTILSELTAGNCAIFRTAKYGDASMMSPGLPVDPSKFAKGEPGTTYLNTIASDREMASRCHKRSDAEIVELVRRFPRESPESPSLEPGLVDAIRARVGDIYDRRREGLSPAEGSGVPSRVPAVVPHDYPAALPGESPEGGLPDFAAANTAIAAEGTGGDEAPRRLSPEQSLEMVLEALRSFPQGATVEELAEKVDRSPQLVRARLREAAAARLAVAPRSRKKPLWTAAG